MKDLPKPEPENAQQISKSFFENQPPPDACVEVWRDWALLLRQTVIRMSKSEKKRRRKVKELRKELDKKNWVFVHYKSKIERLELQTENFESDNDIYLRIRGKILLNYFWGRRNG